jgi:iron complex transport system permease protein
MNENSMSKPGSMLVPKRFPAVLLLGLLLLAASVMLSLAFGSRSVGFGDLIAGLFNPDADSYGADVIRKRVSRTVFCLLCGAALGMSGALMQAVTRNPLADPGILGVNSGAALFVVYGIAHLHISSAGQYIGLALTGAAAAFVFVYGIGSLGRGGATPLKLILAGAATSAALSSLITAILLPRSFAMDQFRFWQVGSVGAGDWSKIALFLPFLAVGVLVALLSASALNALSLGDETAVGLGVRKRSVRLAAAAAGVILCGAATALAGPIGFVGLLATHLVRLVLGPDLRFVIPMSALTGAVVLTVSDVAGRLAGRPGELEVGVVTAFIGAPILILLALKAKVRSL